MGFGGIPSVYLAKLSWLAFSFCSDCLFNLFNDYKAIPLIIFERQKEFYKYD
jgi:hypothetical protein